MISIEIKDVNGRSLSLTDKIKLIDPNTEEVIDEVSSVRLVEVEDRFEIRAFEKQYSYTQISNNIEFIIVGE